MPRNFKSTQALVLPDPKFGSLLATKIIRGMTRRWRETDDIDLPTPYGPSVTNKQLVDS